MRRTRTVLRPATLTEENDIGWAAMPPWIRDYYTVLPKSMQFSADDPLDHRITVATIEDPVSMGLRALAPLLSSAGFSGPIGDEGFATQIGPLLTGLFEFLTKKDMQTGEDLDGTDWAGNQVKDIYERPSRALGDMIALWKWIGRPDQIIDMNLKLTAIRDLAGIKLSGVEPYKQLFRQKKRALGQFESEMFREREKVRQY